MINEQTAGQLIEVLSASSAIDVVLVYGKTCGPCIQTKPNYEMVEKFFSKLRPELQFHQIDLWSEEGRPFKEHTEVVSVPTFVIYSNGVEVAREKGSKEALQIKEFIFKSLEQV